MTADRREAAGCLRRPKGDENGKSQAIENGVRTSHQSDWREGPRVVDPVGQQDLRVSIFEYVLSYHDSYEYRFSWLPCLTQKKGDHS